MMDRYGSQMVLITKEGRRLLHKAFLQPLRYKNKMYLDGTFTQIGYADQGYYLYIGPPGTGVADMGPFDRLAFEGNLYLVTRAERFFVQQEELYCWAILRLCEKEGEGEQNG